MAFALKPILATIMVNLVNAFVRNDCPLVFPSISPIRENNRVTQRGPKKTVFDMTNPDLLKVSVKLIFGSKCSGVADEITITVEKSGEDTIHDVKTKIAEAVGGSVSPDDLLLNFGPNDRKVGRQYYGDPTVDEKSIRLKQYSILSWLERFPHWGLSVSLLPPTPPPPGVAIRKAAAIAENKDPDQAVEDARKAGEIPKIKDLAAPWGPKDFVAPKAEDLVSDGYLPAVYPESSSPLIDA
ncbi:hypothetical protein M9434_006402 [Picochlorum sp. BPE23]|nr:hypothetical protein M9434_006402 [Picochlorum sp. BPE23]